MTCTYFCTHTMHCTYFCPHVMHCADFARKYDHMHIILHIYYAHIMICTYFWTRILQMHILKILSIDIKNFCLIQNFGHHQLKMNTPKITRKYLFALFGWLWLVASADLLSEKNIAGWCWLSVREKHYWQTSWTEWFYVSQLKYHSLSSEHEARQSQWTLGVQQESS